MSRRSGKAMVAMTEEDDESEVEPVVSNAIQLIWDGLSAEAQNDLVYGVVHYLLSASANKQMIKRGDINKKMMGQNARVFPIVMKRAAAKLADTFGLNLVSVDPKKGTYLVSNTLLAGQAKAMLVTSKEELVEDALLMTILGVIFMSGGSMTETSMWNFIERLGYEKDKTYAVFGGVDTIKTIVDTNFLRYGFIDITRISNSEPPENQVTWGARAKVEVSQMNVLKLVSNIYGCDVDDWPDQKRAALTQGMDVDEVIDR